MSELKNAFSLADVHLILIPKELGTLEPVLKINSTAIKRRANRASTPRSDPVIRKSPAVVHFDSIALPVAAVASPSVTPRKRRRRKLQPQLRL